MTAMFRLVSDSSARQRANVRLLQKLDLRSTLSPREREEIMSLPNDIVRLRPRQELVCEGAETSRAFVLLDGYLCRSKTFEDGSRQILAFYVPGDAVDLDAALIDRADSDLAALSECELAAYPQQAIAAAARHPGIAAAFRREALAEEAILRQWMANVGRRDCFGRLAHLYCELAARLDAVGLCRDDAFRFPATQAEIADASGMTPVHVNRTLQRMRAEGLLGPASEMVRIDRERMAAAAGFEPHYLRLSPARTAPAAG
jgi:CRP-like cAMP-binding protein